MNKTAKSKISKKLIICASDAPVIMGVSPWKTHYQLWREKLGLIVPKSNSTRHMKAKEKARKCFEKKTNLSTFVDDVFHPKYSWMMASLDGIDAERSHIVELNQASEEDHRIACEGRVPEHYMPQLQHMLEVTGLDMAYYFSFDGQDGVIVEVGRSTKYIKAMVDAECEFFKNMESFTPPRLTDKDYRRRDDDAFMQYAEEYKRASRELKQAQKKHDDLRDTIIAMCEDDNTICDSLKATKAYKKGNIDYDKIPGIKDIDLDAYRKENGSVWNLSIR